MLLPTKVLGFITRKVHFFEKILQYNVLCIREYYIVSRHESSLHPEVFFLTTLHLHNIQGILKCTFPETNKDCVAPT